ncbi:MAG: murein L,D-transpeptidase catalytic domain family protein [Flavobacteriales bacterium]|nr:murein L,D-transpeptidase catalytic domain family protein [Flavobacteriales bacterium]
MVHTPLLLSLLFAWLIPAKMADRGPRAATIPTAVEEESLSPAKALFTEIGLAGTMEETVFEAGYLRMARYKVQGRMLAIADMTQPSTAERLYLIDLEKKELVLRTWVAHGQATGELMATAFSNREGSHQTSLGLYRVGAEIVSLKHGAALLLHGLEKGINHNALPREVIMHGADYVSADFIAEHGRLGRSWGCPSVSKEMMPRMVDLLADDGVLYIHGKH